MSLKIAIIDDRSVTFRGLIEVLKDAASLELAGVFAAFADPQLLAYPRDALIAVGDPFAQPVRQPLQLPGNLPVVVMSNSTDPDDVRAALRAGARGYLSKGASVTSLVRAIGAVAAGDFYLGSNLGTVLAADRSLSDQPGDDPDRTVGAVSVSVLTPREREVLTLVAQGLTHKQIGQQLGLSKPTVDTYLHRVRRKVRAHNKAGLTRVAMELRLIPGI
ncbi:response regulator transcription factor [Plantactinospora sp. KLBMP9567]|uniref:response regulator transcription factor n=1 Tax=Plantactinospora sp. KLBMP9567 TaxID=3085900 RepID=UPI002981512D|nr:response regulator transcription factor [Plantactinospora sp. KLBMP9567]MDW5326585.1 response regulator transcription factor [Plantactinospora sp. KLBMP9567]